MKNKKIFIFSNSHSLSCLIAREVCDDLKIEIYNLEERATNLLSEEGELKNKIISIFGEKSYINNKFNTKILEGLDYSTSDKLSMIQNSMNDVICKEIKSINKNTIVVSNQIIESGLLYLSDELIVIQFDKVKEYEDNINIESIIPISSYFITPDEIDDMALTLKNCIIEIITN